MWRHFASRLQQFSKLGEAAGRPVIRKVILHYSDINITGYKYGRWPWIIWYYYWLCISRCCIILPLACTFFSLASHSLFFSFIYLPHACHLYTFSSHHVLSFKFIMPVHVLLVNLLFIHIIMYSITFSWSSYYIITSTFYFFSFTFHF